MRSQREVRNSLAVPTRDCKHRPSKALTNSPSESPFSRLIDRSRHSEHQRPAEECYQEFGRSLYSIRRARERNRHARLIVDDSAKRDQRASRRGIRNLRPSAVHAGCKTRRDPRQNQAARESNRCPQNGECVAQYRSKKRGTIAGELLVGIRAESLLAPDLEHHLRRGFAEQDSHVAA